MLPATHHGSWAGPNRLWFEDPVAPERSDGRLQLEDRAIRYEWAFRGDAQSGSMTLAGVPGAVHAEWTDTWHASDGMRLYGTFEDGELRLYTTYSAGEAPEGAAVEWGWRVELDVRDPEGVRLRMFNLPPDSPPMIAVDLLATRE